MTDEDKNLIELAAKAAGLKNYRYCPEEEGLHACIGYDDEDGCTVVWMPHLDDGDALRLAVKLRIHISPRLDHVEARFFDGAAWNCFKERYGDNENAATRRAIVRAAAEIGKAMP